MKRLILALLTGAALAASSPAYAAVKTIVLVHGAFADGSVDFVRDLIHGQPPYWSMRGGSAERESKTNVRTGPVGRVRAKGGR
jgi:hypothetical protein